MKILITVCLGIGTVFFSLICMIILIEIMHFIAVKFTKEKTQLQTPQHQQQSQEIDHTVLVTLIATAVAENIGKDISAIRIHSIKKI